MFWIAMAVLNSANTALYYSQGHSGLALFYAMFTVICLVLGVVKLLPTGMTGAPGVPGATGPKGDPCDCQCKKLCSTTGKQVLLG